MPIKLEDLGWDDGYAAEAAKIMEPGLVPVRIVRDGRDMFHAVGWDGETLAALSGRLRHQMEGRHDWPCVGDWALVQPSTGEGPALIRSLLPRRTAFQRKAPGDATQMQVVAANIDVALLVSALDGGRHYNLRRIERYLALARESGAAPVLVLNKCDLVEDPQPYLDEIASIAAGAPVLAVSALAGTGLKALRARIRRGQTCALLGASGVGKSALVNALCGEDLKETGEVRERDKRGRHTTTYRELLPLPGGALVIDNPGLRELQLWGDEENIAETFPDVLDLAARCKFTNCSHSTEPGCAIRAAIEDGSLPERRYIHYLQLIEELDALAARKDRRARIEEKRNIKRIHRAFEDRKKFKSSGSA